MRFPALVFCFVALAACSASDTAPGETCNGTNCADVGSDIGRDDAGDTSSDGSGGDLDATEDGSGASDASADSADTEPDADPDVTDASDGSADATDTVDVSDGSGADTIDIPDIPTTDFEVQIINPRARASAAVGETVLFEGSFFSDIYTADTASVQWYSSLDGFLSAAPFDAAGRSSFETAGLSPGLHEVTLEATIGDAAATATVNVGICEWPEPFTYDEDLNPAQWQVLYNATRDSRGWLELTDNFQSRRGAIVFVDRPIAEGDLRIRFSISTGQCSTPGPCGITQGADGFAVSIFDLPTAEETIDLLETANSGGGLGYACSGPYGSAVVDAFHIEFDTWYNQINDVEYHTDPSTQNHFEITLNGDPNNSVLWRALPTLEDNEWHDVELSVIGSRIRVLFDGTEIANEEIPGLRFKGGYLAFTGSTGFYTNYHRFDNLAIVEGCAF